MSDREQHDAEFTSYIERAYDGGPYGIDHCVGWMVVFKGVKQGIYRTREEARVKIRSLKPFSQYRPLSVEESAKLEIMGRPWNRFTKVLRDVYDLGPEL